VHTFHSGSTQKALTRSRLVLPPSGELLACAGDEASLAVWSRCLHINCLLLMICFKPVLWYFL